jgi:hypothetical protein
MTTELTKKIDAVIGSYGVSDNNTSVGAGKGGNITYYLFLAPKTTEFSAEVKSVEVSDNAVVWNPEFVSGVKISELRTALDEQVATKIGDFVSPVVNSKIGSQSVSASLVDFDAEQVLLGTKTAEIITPTDRLFVAQEAVSFVAGLLTTDVEKAKTFFSPLAAFLSNFDAATVVWSMTRFLGLEKIVSFNIDENADVDTLFKRASSTLMG